MDENCDTIQVLGHSPCLQRDLKQPLPMIVFVKHNHLLAVLRNLPSKCSGDGKALPIAVPLPDLFLHPKLEDPEYLHLLFLIPLNFCSRST
jgi:hypothetical protein